MKDEKKLLRDSQKRFNAIRNHVYYYRGLPDHTGKTIRDNKKYQDALSQLFLDLSAKLDTLRLEEKQGREAIKQERKVLDLAVQHISMAGALIQHPRRYKYRQMSLHDQFRKSPEFYAELGKVKERKAALKALISEARRLSCKTSKFNVPS